MSLLTSSSIENIKCFLRCKPLSKNEVELSAKCIKISEDKSTISVDMVTENKSEKCFSLDYVFEDKSNQMEIFDKLAKPLLTSFIQGYNCTIFAYGQTGAGKSHTILGPIETLYEEVNENHGLIPRILSFLFNQEAMCSLISATQSQSDIKREVNYSIKCSCLEIYQEHLIDLLKADDCDDGQLTIRENADKGMYIENLTKIDIVNDSQAKELLMTGMKNRHVARTNMNASSSRSHLIFTIFLETSINDDNDITITRSSRLHLIDLAGSERQKATQAMGERIKEAGNINKSLSILGNVINALIEQSNSSKSKFVPFRDSKLTHFLKDSLGGNSKTIIIANISQSVIQLQETISTLKFVQRAKMITNKTIVNENINNPNKIAHLENEVRRLKEIINSLTSLQNNKEGINGNSKGNGNDNLNHKPCNYDHYTNANDTQILLKKLNEFIGYEEVICKKFKFLDLIGMNTIKQFYLKKEKYEKDLEAIISNKLNTEMTINDRINIMKQELDLNKHISQYYLNRKQIETNQSTFSDDFIEKYILLHTNLKEFLSLRFKVSSEIILGDKKQFEQKSFQLEEITIANEENIKMIENLQSENFLLNMELSQYKNGSETDIENNHTTTVNIFKQQISEFSFTPTKSPQSNVNCNNDIGNGDRDIDSSSTKKQFIINLRRSLMKSNHSMNSPFNNNNTNANEVLIIKENLDNALKAIEENEKLISIMHHHNSSIELENNQLKTDISSLKEEIDILNSINSIYKKDIIRLNAELSSMRGTITNSISEISQMLSNSNSKLNSLSQTNDDLMSKMIKCVNSKAGDNEIEMIRYEKAILDLKVQRKQLMEEIKLLNDEFDNTLSSHEKSNAKIRIYTRIKDKSEFKKEYDDLVNYIFELLPLRNSDSNKENNAMIDNRRNNKNAIDRLRKASEVIEMFNYFKSTSSNSSILDSNNSSKTSSNANAIKVNDYKYKLKRSFLYGDKSKSPVKRKK